MSMQNGTESVNMESSSLPSMTYSDISSGSVADPESIPLEHHQAHIQALGAHLQNNQPQQGQHPIHRQEQHGQYPTQQHLPYWQAEKQQDQYQWHQPAWQGDAYRHQETDMPSLVFSGDHSSQSSILQSINHRRGQGQGQIAPGYAQYGAIGAGPAGFAYEGMEDDQNDFLMSVLNMIPPDMNRMPAISYFDYETEFPQRRMLGRGGNGLVRLAYWGDRRCHVVLKNLQEKNSTPVKTDLLFDKEVEVMRICGNHDNVVQFYGIATKNLPDRVERYMIMQYYEMGDLLSVLKLSGKEERGHEAPTMSERLFLALDIALGLDHLLRCGFHHGDLHPKNILIETRASSDDNRGRYQARLTDFGLRRIRNNPNAVSSQPVAGILQFMAPERLIRDRPRYNEQCDIFALGVIYWVLMSGRTPFKDDLSYSPGAREERVDGTPDWYHAVYTQAWSENPWERQRTFEEIIHVFQRQLNLPITTSATPMSHHMDPSQRQPHPMSLSGYPSGYPSGNPSGYHNSVSPSATAYDRSSAGSGGRSSLMGDPTMVASPPNSGMSGNVNVQPTPGKSTNPNHPRNKKKTFAPGGPGWRPSGRQAPSNGSQLNGQGQC